MEDKKVILEVKDLKKYFPLGKGKLDKNKKYVKAVDGVSFKLYEGETLGLVGESGCGKSTLGRAILRLHEPTSGEVHFNGEDILKKNRKEMRKLREEMQIIFQDPYSSLNPRMNVYNILSEPLVAHGYYKKGDELKQYILNLMEKCGLPPYYCYRYPHQFSGGQRQRIGIARSLALDPSFIVCDEPVSALDVSIQEQILRLLEDIQKKKRVSYLFISHDLNVVKRISRRLGVMYAGNLVESGNTKEIYEDPWHPYTKALLSAVLVPDPWKARRKKGILHTEEKKMDIPLGRGCPFAPRCGYAIDCCFTGKPQKYRFGEREVSCFLYAEEHAGKRSSGLKMTSQI